MLKNVRILAIPYGPTEYSLSRTITSCAQRAPKGRERHWASMSPYSSDPGAGGHSLFDFFGGKVQVAIADPLNLKPVPKAVVATAFELNLQHVDGLLHETPARGVRIPVVLHAILEPMGQGTLQRASHEEATEGH